MAYPSPSHEHAFGLWREHKSGQRKETASHVQDLLREAYPRYHVTRTSPTFCDLIGYAAAGHATATPVVGDGHDGTRVYRAPASRVDGQAGALEDVTTFGLWMLTWDQTEFLMYELAYLNRIAQVDRFLYVLTLERQHEAHHPKIDGLLSACGEWTSEAHKQIWVFDNARWVKDSALFASVQTTSWEDVIVSPAVKDRLNQDVVGFFDNRDLYRRAKVSWKRGIIFHGVPGVGKTLFIKTLMRSLAARAPPIPALYVKSLDACAGPRWSMQQIFKKARRTAPCLLVLEDLDSLVGDSTRSYFLNEVDGLSDNDGILMIGSTNHLDQLDPAVTKRPSRFDRKYHFQLPTEEERLAYCYHWRGKFIDTDHVAFPCEICPVMSRLTDGFSFAYLKELFVSSLLLLVGGNGDAPAQSGIVTSGTESADDLSPELANNPFLRTFRSQAQTLREDMNQEVKSSTDQSNASRPPNPTYRIESLLDEPER
ncbi:hypothetical protein LTR56_025102 [Elasticomyces elasticus]|nr:hypothetical protein LTR56_025102 [Elasticomyces elasticus]KAK3663256.1 hypothetical protein LTR22_005914 [Elasticomyces elasticus]KAK4929087.1 hypothetical protein LTR49_004284 [Elasticomyces elasticus]KAK5766466.1 hypothetical protein LTS12_003383 [Elasticomyces elasticus]